LRRAAPAEGGTFFFPISRTSRSERIGNIDEIEDRKCRAYHVVNMAHWRYHHRWSNLEGSMKLLLPLLAIFVVGCILDEEPKTRVIDCGTISFDEPDDNGEMRDTASVKDGACSNG
jgi:hypothetical protein